MGHRRQLTARALRDALGGVAHAVTTSGASLEVSLAAQDAGRTRRSTLLTDREMMARPVAAAGHDSTTAFAAGHDTTAAFAAFLDGVQESRVVAYLGTVPLVHGRTGAVIRARVDRRLVTWGDGPRIDDALYVPMAVVSGDVLEALASTGCPVIDTVDDTGADATPLDEVHPQQWLRRAVHLVQRGREALERELAEAWCASGAMAPLYVDGGLPPSEVVLHGGCAIGVIKSHHTLYATGAALATVMSLGAGERSSTFVVETRWREPVASWYLRLRTPGGHDPLWGLVRIESPLAMLTEADADSDAVADQVSRWVAAEASPLSLPDSRWDTMAYGIRDCEVYLRATLGRQAT